MSLDQHQLVERLLTLVVLWISLSVHEWGHAWAAWRLGDDTAALLGRLTLNPLAHIDPIGTVLLPLLGIPFGWAKPVPVQPHRFRRDINMRTGMMLTAIAGPAMNLVLAAISILLFGVVLRYSPFLGALVPNLAVPAIIALLKLLPLLIVVNVLLAAFNLLPIPPLDGSRVADAIVPNALQPLWRNYCSMGPMVLAAVIILPRLSGVNLFQWPLDAAYYLIQQVAILAGA